jgi:spermidine/putrescine transport system ATP-binding protein
MSDMVELRNVSCRYGALAACDDISLTIKDGEFFSLLGPSGCGKTTLLRMMAGFMAPTGGTITIDGRPMAGVPPDRRPTNLVFQNYALFPHLTVGRNIAYGLRRAGLSRAERQARVDGALSLVRLVGLADRKPDALSGGQRQRVALARALAVRPKVLLLDEPLSALDRKLREEMQMELRALQRQVGVTFVLVTHDQEEAFALSDRIAVMFGGKVSQVASPRTLYQTPLTREVASFIGQINLIPANILSLGTRSTRVDCEGFGPLDIAGEMSLPPGTRVQLAMRPERLRLSLLESGTARRVRVLSTSYLGDRNLCFVEMSGTMVPLTVTLPADQLLPDGATAWLSLDVEKALLLPA